MQVDSKDVIPLLTSCTGWKPVDVRLVRKDPKIYSGDPGVITRIPVSMQTLLSASYEHTAGQLTAEGKPRFTNGSKVTLREFVQGPNTLFIATGITDFYTARGGYYKALELLEQGRRDLIDKHATNVPIPISTHNIILTPYGILAVVRSKGQGFFEGNLSPSFEEQTERSDNTTFTTTRRGAREEFGMQSKRGHERLLGVGLEKKSAYACIVHVLETPRLTREQIIQQWQEAPDHNEASALFIVPTDEVGELTQAIIYPSTWKRFHVDGEIIGSTEIYPHPTSVFRIQLLQDFIQSGGFKS